MGKKLSKESFKKLSGQKVGQVKLTKKSKIKMSKKIIAFVLAAGLLFGGVTAGSAVTVEELQAQIAELTALIASLQAQLAGQTTPATGAVCFYTDLEQGMTSAEVKKLQETLNLDPATRVAASGAGAPGSETTYFGALTLAAVKAFQAKHGIITTGYVGPLTRGQLNALYCTPTTPTTAPGETTTTTLGAGTEGSLTVTQNPLPGSGTVTLYGGNVNKEISAYKIKATGSDVRVKRIILQFGIATPSDFPWRDISTISIWDGSTLLREIAATAANFVEVTFGTTYTLQLDGLDVLVAKDTEKVLSVKATALAVPQYAGNITVLIPANGVRGVDSLGLNVYNATALTAHTFAAAAAQAPTITTTAAIDSPVAGNFNGSLSEITRVEVMKINLKVEAVDMTFKGGTFTVDTNDNSVLQAVELYDGSTLLASAATTTTGTLTWSTFTLPVSADTTKVLTVKAVITAAPDAGSAIAVSLPNAGLTGIDNNGTARNSSGAITGNTLTVYTASPVFALASASSLRSDSSTTTVNNVGDFTIGISITANGGDIYIPSINHATYGAGTGTEGIFQSVSTAGTESATGSNWYCDSVAVEDTTNNMWRIPHGATAVCTYQYHTVNITTAAWYNVSILSIRWGTGISNLNGGGTNQLTGLSALKATALWLQI